MNEIIPVLTEYGLDDREAALYLAGLEIGESGMASIAKLAGIKRPSAYLIFKTLEQKGLMGSFKMKHGLRFVSTKPEILVARAKAKAKNLESILPSINALIGKSAHKPRITYYEGREGLLTAVEETLKTTNTTMRHIGSLKEAHKIIGEEYDLNHYMPTRIKKNIFLKALYFPYISSRITSRDDAADLREIRFLPIKYNNNTSTVIMDDRIIITAGSKELISVVIESKEIAFSEQQRFDLVWDLVGEKKSSK
jgi:sugar-specific transcriptional regulator TrmB